MNWDLEMVVVSLIVNLGGFGKKKIKKRFEVYIIFIFFFILLIWGLNSWGFMYE